jgi:hypothetical protein
VAEYACRNYGDFRDFGWATGGTVFASCDYDDAALQQIQSEDLRREQFENLRWESEWVADEGREFVYFGRKLEWVAGDGYEATACANAYRDA